MIYIDYKTNNDELKITLRGHLDAAFVSKVWRESINKLESTKPSLLEIDASGVEYCNGAGAALILQLKQKQETQNRRFSIVGLRKDFEQLINIFDPGIIRETAKKGNFFLEFVKNAGRMCCRVLNDTKAEISFLGELLSKLLAAFIRPSSLKWSDTFLIAEKSGANAVGITCLLGFLIGVILSFQSAIAMQQFGAQIYVADLIVISLFRELGPLITAIIFAARSGSAYAAEIGTMKVNEEIDALVTMGIDPIKYLAVPRMLSGIFMMPLLTMFNLLLGLIGCGLVMLSLGFSPIVYLNRIQEAATLGDLAGGLAKTLVFGLVIAGIGCFRGLQTATGASAVGDSATKSVVSSIIAIIFLDGVFAVVYYYVGI